MVLVPDILGEVLGEERLGAFGELRPADEVVGRVKVHAHVRPALGLRVRQWDVLCSRIIATHCQ